MSNEKIYSLDRLRVFQIHVVKQTETQPRRVSINDTWQLKRVILSCPDEDVVIKAFEYLESRGIKITATSSDNDSFTNLFMSPDFETSIK